MEGAVGSLIDVRSKRSWDSTFEDHAEKVAFTPNHAAVAHRSKAVERNAELEGHDAQPVQSDTRSVVGHVADAARVNAIITRKKHQRASVNDGPAFRSALEDFSILR